MMRMSVATWREISREACVEQATELVVRNVQDLGGLLVGEAFDGHQQEGLARPWREVGKVARGALLPDEMRLRRRNAHR